MACYRVLVKMFGGSLNPVTGKQEWVLQDRDVSSEEADISKELARSQYGDMLHDRERVGYSIVLHELILTLNTDAM